MPTVTAAGGTRAQHRPAGWGTAWRQAASYLGQGLAVVRRAPGAYLLLTGVYATPALLAGVLTGFVTLEEPRPWQRAAIVALPWITIVLGTVVIMVTVGYDARGQAVGFGRATGEAIRWVPRYVWTNVHTSAIFWVPVGLLVAVHGWQAEALLGSGAAGAALEALWRLLIGALAVYLHVRTLLAPFLAVHADQPGTLAAVEAWRLAGRHFPICFATLVLGTLPVGLPLALLALVLVPRLPAPTQASLQAAAPDLVWAGIQAVRPVLIPTVYPLYRELWHAELDRRRQRGAPGVPRLAQLLLWLTRPLPKPGRWS